MLPLIEQHRPKIHELCVKYGVGRLELFGSAARGDFNSADSDLDFFVEFADTGWKGSFKRYMGLKIDLEETFGRSVDLVELASVKNPYFVEVATRHRELLYAA
jgi:predicted nucleotidyltransferase